MASDDSQALAARQPDLAMRDELTTQLSLAPTRFVVINTAGVVELEKRRPVDVLALILEEKNTAKLEQFFRSYGAAEVAAMCFMLATQPPSAIPQASQASIAALPRSVPGSDTAAANFLHERPSCMPSLDRRHLLSGRATAILSTVLLKASGQTFLQASSVSQLYTPVGNFIRKLVKAAAGGNRCVLLQAMQNTVMFPGVTLVTVRRRTL